MCDSSLSIKRAAACFQWRYCTSAKRNCGKDAHLRDNICIAVVLEEPQREKSAGSWSLMESALLGSAQGGDQCFQHAPETLTMNKSAGVSSNEASFAVSDA